MAEAARYLALAAMILLTTGCTVYGGATSARISGATLSTSSTSASIGAKGVRTEANRTVMELALPD